MSKIARLGFIFALFILVSGCTYRPAEEKADTSDSAQSGSPSPFSKLLPDSFPKDLPILDEAYFENKGEIDSSSGFVVFSVKLPPLQITKYYEENLDKFGWRIEAKSNDGKNASFSTVKNNKASTIGVRFVNESETLLTITYGPK